jgi:glycosyltransferase involved in cell wall biosynthesis
VKNRLAYMTGEYPRATDTFIQREVAALRSLGYDIKTFSIRQPAMKENVGPEQESERQQTTYILPASPKTVISSHFRGFVHSPKHYFRAIALAWQICPPGMRAFFRQVAYFAEAGIVADSLRSAGIRHLHNHFANSSGSVAAIAAEMGGFSYSLTIHGPAEFFEPKFWRIDEKVRRALFVNCISYFCRSQVMVFAPPPTWERLHIIHCGVDPAMYQPRTHQNPARRLLFAGRLAAVKGLAVLLEAFAKLHSQFPDIQLTVAGDGPDRLSLQAQAKIFGLRDSVEFLGYQSQDQIRQLLAQTDVFVMSSFAEGVPVVLMEAMAAGVPVVATRIAGVPELVEDGVSGFLTPPGDAQSTAEKISILLGDAELRNRFGAAGRAMVEKEFNIGIEARRMARIIESALAGRGEVLRPAPLD